MVNPGQRLQGGTAGTSVLQKGSPANAVVAVIMAIVLAIGLMPLPGYSGQAFADDENQEQQGSSFEPALATVAPLAEGGAAADTPREPDGYGVAITKQGDTNTYNAVFSGTGLVKHKNGADPASEGYWMGIAIPNMNGLNSRYGTGEFSESNRGKEYTGVGQDNIRLENNSYSDGGYDDFWFKLENGQKAFVAVYANGDNDPVVYQLDFSAVTCRYTIAKGTVENGTLTVAEYANNGAEVTVEATPSTGYVLDKLTYTVEGSNAVEINDGKFTMPTSNVTIDATFKQVPGEPVAEEKVDPTFKVKTAQDGEETTTATVEAGSTTTLYLDTDTDGQVAVSSDATDKATVAYEGNVITITGVAAGEATVTVSAAAGETKNAVSKAITVTVTEAETPGDEPATVNKESLETAIAEANKALAAAKVSTDGADVATDAKWVSADAKTAFENAIAAAQAIVNDQNATAEEVSKAATDLAAAKETFEKAQRGGTKEVETPTEFTYKVMIEKTENGTVTADKTEGLKKGDTVTLTVEPADGYELETLSASYSSDVAIPISDNKFTMPGEDNVTVKATFKKKDAETTDSEQKTDDESKDTDTDKPTTTPEGSKDTDTDKSGASEPKDTDAKTDTKTDEQKTDEQKPAYTPSENALTDEETGVIVDGDILAELPEGVQSFELDVTETTDKAEVAELAQTYSQAIEGGEVAGVYEVDLKALMADGTIESVTEGVGAMKLTFPVDVEDGTIVKVIQLHKDGETTEVIEHELQRVADGKVVVTLADKLSTFIVTTQAETKVMHRLYNPFSGEHFYTASDSERDNLVKEGWNDEKEGWIAPTLTDIPVYRLYNKYEPLGDHHYTKDEKERDTLVALGWVDEGIGWYSADEKGVPLYRVYNPNAYALQMSGSHHYTADKSEADHLSSVGWNYEEIAWYGIASDEADANKAGEGTDADKADANKADEGTDADKAEATDETAK